MRKQSHLIYTDSSAIDIHAWLHNLSLERAEIDEHLLKEACHLAQITGEAHKTPNGESCLHQGLAMAELLSDLNLDDQTLATAIVYSCVRHADLRLEDIEEHLGHSVVKLIDGTQQMDAVHALHEQLSQRTHLSSTIDNLRKMLLAMVSDVRVVLIKLAERLCILRNMLAFNEDQKKRIAKETMDIYAPLANRLGIGHLKWQLEDLSFRYLNPEDYLRLSKGIKERRIDRENYVRNFVKVLKEELSKVQITNSEVTGRAKHIYSIFKKMQRKKVSLNEIYDAIAFRILVATLEDCYAVLGVVHSLWDHIPKEFDDYITHPKLNGYRSIHTAVVGPENKHVEIQIRTFDMHQEAELGVAAHWLYKEGSDNKAGYEQKISWLRQVLDWQKEMTEGAEDSQKQIFEDRLYVFTPNGDVIDLPSGATPLDFAYQIHSELGHRCRGAKVNGAIVPLTYSLHSGEKVELLTTKQGHPSRDWVNPHLGYLKTNRAKAKVLSWFRKQDYDRNLTDGHELLDKELKRLGFKEITYDGLATKLNFKSKEEMFAALGRGDLRIHTVITAANQLHEAGKVEEEVIHVVPELPKSKIEIHPTDIVIEGVGNLLTHLAKCCKPVPGDEIVGYVTVGKGVSIHRSDCTNLVQRFSLSEDRKVGVVWGSKVIRKYPVDLSVLSYEKSDLAHEITTLLANERVPIVAMNTVHSQKNHTMTVYLTIEIDSLNPLSKILGRISQLRDVISVHRE